MTSPRLRRAHETSRAPSSSSCCAGSTSPPTTTSTTTPAALVDRILSVGAVGRGAPDLELVGATTSRSWGPRPTDPALLSDAELLRFVVTLLAEDIVRAGRAQAPPRDPLPLRARRRLRRRAPGHRLLGDPWLLEPLRDDLLRQGRRLGGPESSVVLVGTDLATMLVDTFTARAFDDGVAPWRRWLHTGHGDRPLPPRIDLARVARRWSDEVGAKRVVVLADASRAAEALPLRRRTTIARPRPSADAVDLARRVAAPLGLLVPPPERRALLRGVLLPLLLADNAKHPAPALAVPAGRLTWVVRQAEEMRDDLVAAGYAVVGDPGALVPGAGAATRGAAPDTAGVLALAIRLLLAGAAEVRGEDEVER